MTGSACRAGRGLTAPDRRSTRSSPMMLAPWTAIAQAGGDVVRLPADRFLLLLAGIPRLRELSLAYALAQSYLMSRSVLCNRFHELTERAARWLLTFAT